MRSVLILGAYGLVGYPLSSYLEGVGNKVYRHGRKETAEISLDITNSDSLRQFISEKSIDVVINLVAATSVDLCEGDSNYAYDANAKIVQKIVDSIQSIKGSLHPHLIQFSTDHVYGGKGPHSENQVLVLNEYAKSKLAGEIIASSVNATILRTNFFGRSDCPNRSGFSDWIFNALISDSQINIFDDIFISALHMSTLCEAIRCVIDKKIYGIFNLGSLDGGSKAYFALKFGRGLGFSCENFSTVSSKAGTFIAKRPCDMRMDSTSFSRAFNFELPSFDSQIDLAIKEYSDAKK